MTETATPNNTIDAEVIERDGPPETAIVNVHDVAGGLVPAEQLQAQLTTFSESRNTFRAWLLSNLDVGVHFGYPPGTGPGNGNPDQWQTKPSLYDAGAGLLADLCRLRASYVADRDAWQMMGSHDGAFVIRCELFSKVNGELVGEGLGVCTIAERETRKGNPRAPHDALSMAKKRAFVQAVRSSLAITDLFTDNAGMVNTAEPSPQPERDAGAPTVASRAERQGKPHADPPPDPRMARLVELAKLFAAAHPDMPDDIKRGEMIDLARHVAEREGVEHGNLATVQGWPDALIDLMTAELQGGAK